MSTTDRIQLPEQVTAEQRTKAADLMAGVDAAVKALQEFDAPSLGTRLNLGPGETVDDWGEADEVPLVLVCPWCGEDARQEDIYDREVAERWSKPTTIDSDDRVVIISYDGYGDFDSITLVHEQCGLPVSLPDGWEQE